MTDTTQTPLLLRDRDVAVILGISRALVWKLSSTGELPSPIRIPGTRAARWQRDDIIATVARWTEARS